MIYIEFLNNAENAWSCSVHQFSDVSFSRTLAKVTTTTDLIRNEIN